MFITIDVLEFFHASLSFPLLFFLLFLAVSFVIAAAAVLFIIIISIYYREVKQLDAALAKRLDSRRR